MEQVLQHGQASQSSGLLPSFCASQAQDKRPPADPPTRLSSEELKKAHLKIVQHLQRKAWPDEFQRLSSKKPVLLSSPTAKLNPYLDSSGVIRVGGRLSKSKTLPAEVQHPILLPKIPLVKFFLLDFHHKHHHPGPSAMEALPVLLSCGMQADGQIRVQALRGVQKSPSQDHQPVYGRPPRPQILPCQAIRLHRSGFCWSLRCQKRSHQETRPSQSLCLPLCLYEHQSSAHRLHRRPQHSFLHAVL